MFSKILEIVDAGKSFLVTSHVRLDGDAIGSELALCLLLRAIGKEATVYNQDPTPESYLFLPGAGDLIFHKLDADAYYDAVFALDCSELERIGDESVRIGGISPIINIDHHISNRTFGNYYAVDPGASSTGELLFRMAEEAGWELSPEIATNLYTAILTDTGSFRYSNTGAGTFSVAGALVERGADPAWIAEQVYDSVPAQKVKLLHRALGTIGFASGGRICSVLVSRRMMEEVQARPEHAENFAEFIRSISGVEVSIFFTEISDRQYKVSFRSKGSFDVEEIAGRFGGGGHRNAAACRLPGAYEEVRHAVMAAVQAKMK
ncbi:MAG TPA: bifunctional oligoribonuclease/PAP phosphatase NrnA [Syntrophales bacterium]|nr:bifunctional oligoribonuclease/PAP phosphatase NrnA [Syntrophales bacterium]